MEFNVARLRTGLCKSGEVLLPFLGLACIWQLKKSKYLMTRKTVFFLVAETFSCGLVKHHMAPFHSLTLAKV